MSTKLCVDCGELPKKTGHPKWCALCWLERQPMTVQVEHARFRLSLVPEGNRVARVPPRSWPEGHRWCAGCQTFTRLRYVSGSRCRACASAAAHAGRLKSTYVLRGRPFTDADYDALLRLQGGRCHLCRRAVRSKRLAVDHDHATGEVRGLLCPGDRWCNLAIIGGIEAASQDGGLAMAQRIVAYLSGDTPAEALTTR